MNKRAIWAAKSTGLFTPTVGCLGAIVTSKVGQTDLVFGMPPGFISRSVRTRLQVSVCSGYDLFRPDTKTQTNRQHLDQLI